MKKIAITLMLSLGVLVVNHAQSIRESRITALDADRMGFSIEFNFDQKVLQDAWDKKCTELSIKSKPSKGLDVYAAVLVPDIHFESIDVYSKVDKLDKTRSTFAITVSKGNTNFISNDEAKLVSNLKVFLEKFIIYAEQYKLGLDIADQHKQITDTQKAYDKLIEEGKKLQEQIDKNKVDQENRVKEIEALNKGLEELKLRVKK